MSIKEFLIKSLIITACIAFLLYNFYPRYEFLKNAKVDKVSGDINYISSYYSLER